MDKAYYKKPEYLALWIHILLRANHEPREWLYKGEIKSVERGQFITSRKSLSLETGIKQSTIEDILKLFESSTQIRQQNMFTSRLITIVNYDTYQDNPTAKRQQSDSQPTASRQPADTNNNKKNEKNERIKEDISLSVRAVVEKWNSIKTDSPKSNISVRPGVPIMTKCKNITPELAAAINKKLKEYGEEGIITAITEYAAEIVRRKPDEGGYYQHRFRLIEFIEQKNGLRKFIT